MAETSKNQHGQLEHQHGQLLTPYKHFTVIADGVAGRLESGFECRPGTAVMSIKIWATNADESAHMVQLIGQQIGFSVNGEIEIYETEAERPAGEDPYGYDIRFTPYGGA